MIPLSTMCPIADGSLKDHERDLFYAFLSLLADDAEPQDLVALVFWRKPTGQSSVLAATGLPAQEPSAAVGIFGDAVLRWVLRHNRPLVLDNGVGVLGRLQEALDRAGLRSAAIFPLTHRGDPAGALVLGRRTGPSPFVFVDLALVTLFGHLLSAAFERLGLFEWMQANAAGRQADPCREAGSVRTDQMSREAASPPRRAGRFHPPSSPSAAAHHCRSIAKDADAVHCECGCLLVKLTPAGLEVKCRRCKRMHVLPGSAVGSAKSRGTESKLRSTPD